MTLGIEAVNIRNGGGLDHLRKMIEFTNRSNHFSKIVVFTNSKTSKLLRNNSKIILVNKTIYDLPFIFNLIYQFFFLKRDLKKFGCSIVFVPGTIFLTKFPFVVLPQNMLAFDKIERSRFGFFQRLKLELISSFHIYSIKKANSVIFLSNYAKNIISKNFSSALKHTVIPHGITSNHFETRKINKQEKLKLLYVSPFYPYKHQDKVIHSVVELVNEGLNLDLTLVGHGASKEMIEISSKYNFINIVGHVEPSKINYYYKKSDLFIFASTCENFPITLLEAMSFGLPVLCSNYGVMPEVLNSKSEVYFNPLEKYSIKKAIRFVYNDENILKVEAVSNYKKSLNYNWDNTFNLTFDFIKNSIS